MAENENDKTKEQEQEQELKKSFYARLASFLVLAIVVPCSYLIIRFHLFTQTSAMQLGIWGIICIGIIFLSISVLIKFYLDGMKHKYSYFKQILSGIVKLILPMGVILLLCTWLKDNMSQLIEVLYVLLPCEFGAILVNPLPKWCFDNNVEGLGEIYDKVMSRGKDKK